MVTRTLRHDSSILRESDGVVKFDDLIEKLKVKFAGTLQWTVSAWVKSLAKGGGHTSEPFKDIQGIILLIHYGRTMYRYRMTLPSTSTTSGTLTHMFVRTHNCASKTGRPWLLRNDRSTRAVSRQVHPLTDNLLPTVQERWLCLLSLSFLHPTLFPRAMTFSEIRTKVINLFSCLFATPALLLHVTINLEIRTSPRRDPTPQRTPVHVCLHPAEGATGQGLLYPLCLPPVSPINLGSAPASRVNSSSACGTATNSPGQSQRASRQAGRDTLMSVPRERHSTPLPRNSRQSAIRALAGNMRDTASAVARLLAPTRSRPSSRSPN